MRSMRIGSQMAKNGFEIVNFGQKLQNWSVLVEYGRFQTLLRESVKFSNFEKLFWSRDSA